MRSWPLISPQNYSHRVSGRKVITERTENIFRTPSIVWWVRSNVCTFCTSALSGFWFLFCRACAVLESFFTKRTFVLYRLYVRVHCAQIRNLAFYSKSSFFLTPCFWNLITFAMLALFSRLIAQKFLNIMDYLDIYICVYFSMSYCKILSRFRGWSIVWYRFI